MTPENPPIMISISKPDSFSPATKKAIRDVTKAVVIIIETAMLTGINYIAKNVAMILPKPYIDLLNNDHLTYSGNFMKES